MSAKGQSLHSVRHRQMDVSCQLCGTPCGECKDGERKQQNEIKIYFKYMCQSQNVNLVQNYKVHMLTCKDFHKMVVLTVAGGVLVALYTFFNYLFILDLFCCLEGA